jgi:glycosyltransferase involved in cell wall biosynthesis
MEGVRPLSPIKRAIRRYPGQWPVLDARNKLVGALSILRNRRFERAESARLGVFPKPGATVAVIIPTYRRPESLLRAVHSALDQTFTDVVLMIVDDGGGLPTIPADPRITAVSLSRNTRTVGLVRNVGIRLSDSEFLAFLDDDNTWTPDHLATLVEVLRGTPELGGAYTSIDRIEPDGRVRDSLSMPFDRQLLRNTAFVDMNALMLRRAARVRFSDLPRTGDRPPAEDWELVWRLSRHASFRHVARTTVRYTLNPNSYFADWYHGGSPSG